MKKYRMRANSRLLLCLLQRTNECFGCIIKNEGDTALLPNRNDEKRKDEKDV